MENGSGEFISGKELQRIVFEYTDATITVQGESEIEKVLNLINGAEEKPELQVQVWNNKLEFLLDGLTVQYIQHVKRKNDAIQAKKEKEKEALVKGMTAKPKS